MRRRIVALCGGLLIAAGAAGCNGGHSSETPNNVQTQPGGACQGKSCSPSAGTPAKTGTGYGGGSGDGNVNH